MRNHCLSRRTGAPARYAVDRRPAGTPAKFAVRPRYCHRIEPRGGARPASIGTPSRHLFARDSDAFPTFGVGSRLGAENTPQLDLSFAAAIYGPRDDTAGTPGGCPIECNALRSQSHQEAMMAKVRVAAFSVSLAVYGAGTV